MATFNGKWDLNFLRWPFPCFVSELFGRQFSVPVDRMQIFLNLSRKLANDHQLRTISG